MNMLPRALYGDVSWEDALKNTLTAPSAEVLSGGRLLIGRQKDSISLSKPDEVDYLEHARAIPILAPPFHISCWHCRSRNLAYAASDSSGTPQGLTSIQSSFGPEETLDRLEAEIRAHGMTIFARIDHAAGAREADWSCGPRRSSSLATPAVGRR